MKPNFVTEIDDILGNTGPKPDRHYACKYEIEDGVNGTKHETYRIVQLIDGSQTTFPIMALHIDKDIKKGTGHINITVGAGDIFLQEHPTNLQEVTSSVIQNKMLFLSLVKTGVSEGSWPKAIKPTTPPHQQNGAGSHFTSTLR